MTDAVVGWDTSQSLHPTLSIEASTSPDDLMQALGSGLSHAGFDLIDQRPDGFSARQSDLIVVRIIKPVETTVLDVDVNDSAGPGASWASVRVRTGPQRRPGVRRAADGLSQAVGQLRHRGIDVTVHQWAYPADGTISDEVPGWDKRVQSFHPQMSCESQAAASVILDALARGLQGVGYKMKRQSATGFRVRYHSWLRMGIDLATMAGASAERTTLDVDASSAGAATVATVRVAGGFEHWHSRDLAAEGLTVALRELRNSGHEVAVTPWVAS